MTRVLETVLWIQGIYFLVTGAALLNAVVATVPVTITVFITGISTAMVLLMTDLVYVAKSVISKIYLVDACIQLLLVMLWCISIF